MCGSDDPWVCNECNSFRFSESFFDKSICVDMDSDNKNQNENIDDIFDELIARLGVFLRLVFGIPHMDV
jgi:hypothetical protein